MSLFIRNRLVVFTTLVFVFLNVSTGVLFAQEVKLPEGIKKFKSIEGVTEYRLDNGLKVLLYPNTSKAAYVEIAYLVGSKHENYGETGMAHLLEHLVFKGTPKHPNITREFTERGALPNGTTSVDRTNYFEAFNATDENIEWALELEADRMINSFISKKDLESEFSVVRNELERGENDPFASLSMKIQSVAFDWHNYGKSTIGARSDIENVSIDNLRAFYKKYYQPDNAILIVAGGFDESKVLQMVKKHFGSIQKPKRKLPKFYTEEPIQKGEISVTIRQNSEKKMVAAGYHAPPVAHPDFTVFSVINEFLINQPSGRLYKKLVDSKKATSTFNFGPNQRDRGYAIYAVNLTKDADTDDVGNILTSELEGLYKNPPTEQELSRIKAKLEKRNSDTETSPLGVSSRLPGWHAVGDWRLYFLFRDAIKTVTVDDVKKVAKKYFKRSNRTLGKFIPEKTPDRSVIPKVSEDEIAKKLEGYKGGKGLAQGEVFEATAENIESRVERFKIGQISAHFLNKETTGDKVSLYIKFPFGDEKSLTNRMTATNLAGMLLSRGTKIKDHQKLTDEQTSLKSNIQMGVRGQSVLVFIDSDRKNLGGTIRLAAEMLKEASFPASEFEKLKKKTLTDLENAANDPQRRASMATEHHLNRFPKGHPHYAGTYEEQYEDAKKITLEDLKRSYRDFFGVTNATELAVVGDFDKKEIVSLIDREFRNWKAKTGYSRIRERHMDVKPIEKSIETPDKSNAFFNAKTYLRIRDDNPDYAAFVIGEYIFGKGFIDSRIANRLRQKDGLSYAMGSNHSASSTDSHGTFSSFAIYAPQNRDRVVRAFKEEISKLVEEGITSAELKKAKGGYLKTQRLFRNADALLAQRLVDLGQHKRTFKWDADHEKRIESLTVEDVNAAIRKYIDPKKITIVTAGDFAGAKKAVAGKK